MYAIVLEVSGVPGVFGTFGVSGVFGVPGVIGMSGVFGTPGVFGMPGVPGAGNFGVYICQRRRINKWIVKILKFY